MDQLTMLFEPRTVAIVGAAEGKFFSDNLVRVMLDSQTAPELWLVNPRRTTAYGRKTYGSLAEVPADIECVVLLVSAEACLEQLTFAGNRGVRGAVVVASGFAETGVEGRRRQADLTKIAREFGIEVCGPNCNGIIGVHAGANLFGGPQYCSPAAGSVSVVSQSGALIPPLLLAGDERGIGWSRIVSSGNEAVLDVCDYLESFLEDVHTSTVCCIVEEIRDIPRFAAAAMRARERSKVILGLKLGRSEKGGVLAATHTGAIAGEGWIYEQLFAQWGVVAARSLDDLLDIALILSQLSEKRAPLPSAEAGISVISISGGAAEAAADLSEELDMPLADWSGLSRRLTHDLPGGNDPQNPFDLTGFMMDKPDLYRTFLESVLKLPATAALLVVWDVRDTHKAWFEVLPDLAQRTGKPVFLSAAIGFELQDWAREWIRSDDCVLVGYGLRGTMMGIRSWLERAVTLRDLHTERSEERAPAGQVSDDVAHRANPSHETSQSFGDVMALLTDYGFEVAPFWLVGPEDQVDEKLPREPGPYVVKLAEIPHRTGLRAIRLPVCPGDLRTAVGELRELARQRGLPGRVVVQPFLRGDAEFYLGGLNHDHFGPLVLFGLGGYLLEPLHDVSARRAPIALSDATTMIASLRARKVFEGYRAKGAWNTAGLAEAILAMQTLLLGVGTSLRSIDVNPLIVNEGRYWVVDAAVTRVQS
jgi:acyl-CoA synthetase (NDP forming)